MRSMGIDGQANRDPRPTLDHHAARCVQRGRTRKLPGEGPRAEHGDPRSSESRLAADTTITLHDAYNEAARVSFLA